MKTILFIYPTPFNPQAGGVERVTDLLAKGFITRGYKVMYLHHEHKEGLMNYDFPAPVFFFPDSNYRSSKNVPFYHHFLQENKVDIIINQCGLFEDSVLYNNIGENKCKIISVFHSNPMINYEHLSQEELVLKEKTFMGVVKLIARFILYPKIKFSYLARRRKHFNFILSHSDKICLLSESYKLCLKKYCDEYAEEKIVSIPNPKSFKSQRDKKKMQLLYIGRLEYGAKRPDRLLKIWKRLYRKFPNWELFVVGDGKERGRLELQARKMERISFVGFQSPERYYRDASILCLTSSFEGFPMVLLEAMTFGVVPFAYDSFSAVHDIIEDGKTGILVTPFSIKEYADKLAILMNEKEKCLQMSENCIENAVRFDLSNILVRWESLFDSLEKSFS